VWFDFVSLFVCYFALFIPIISCNFNEIKYFYTITDNYLFIQMFKWLNNHWRVERKIVSSDQCSRDLRSQISNLPKSNFWFLSVVIVDFLRYRRACKTRDSVKMYCGRVPWDARFSLFAAPVENHARPRVVVQAANENLNKADGFPEWH